MTKLASGSPRLSMGVSRTRDRPQAAKAVKPVMVLDGSTPRAAIRQDQDIKTWRRETTAPRHQLPQSWPHTPWSGRHADARRLLRDGHSVHNPKSDVAKLKLATRSPFAVSQPKSSQCSVRPNAVVRARAVRQLPHPHGATNVSVEDGIGDRSCVSDAEKRGTIHVGHASGAKLCDCHDPHGSSNDGC